MTDASESTGPLWGGFKAVWAGRKLRMTTADGDVVRTGVISHHTWLPLKDNTFPDPATLKYWVWWRSSEQTAWTDAQLEVDVPGTSLAPFVLDEFQEDWPAADRFVLELQANRWHELPDMVALEERLRGEQEEADVALVVRKAGRKDQAVQGDKACPHEDDAPRKAKKQKKDAGARATVKSGGTKASKGASAASEGAAVQKKHKVAGAAGRVKPGSQPAGVATAAAVAPEKKKRKARKAPTVAAGAGTSQPARAAAEPGSSGGESNAFQQPLDAACSGKPQKRQRQQAPKPALKAAKRAKVDTGARSAQPPAASASAAAPPAAERAEPLPPTPEPSGPVVDRDGIINTDGSYRGPTGRTYPRELCVSEGDRSIEQWKGADSVCDPDAEYRVLYVVDELWHGKQHYVLPKWQGFEVDPSWRVDEAGKVVDRGGWEPVQQLRGTEALHQWKREERPAHFKEHSERVVIPMTARPRKQRPTASAEPPGGGSAGGES